jgi:signal recognition particle receptor subunit beta
MAHINRHTQEVSATIVYYGPEGSGKTASVEFIHRKLRSDLRRKLSHVQTQLDPTVTYEVIPVELGEIKGMRTRFEISSAPGDPIHRSTRKTILRDVDGIVFVADARNEMMEQNIESLKDLEENLAAYGRDLDEVPLAFQWNHSDEPGALDPETLDRRLNPRGAQAFQTVATEGTGILQTLTTIAKLILRRLRPSAPAPAKDAVSAVEPAGSETPEGAPRATFRVAEPPPPSNLVNASPDAPTESLDLEPLMDEVEAGPVPEPAEAIGQPAGVEDLPEATVEELAPEANEDAEITEDLDIPMEPLPEGAETGASIDALEAGFESIDFTTEVTNLAERGEVDEDWEITGVGNPTRRGPASFSIQLEISAGGQPPRSAELTITLSVPRGKRNDP